MRLLLLLLLCIAFPALAHKPSDAYLTIQVSNRVTGAWHLAVRDLDYDIGLDANDDGDVTWGELESAERKISAYAFARLRVRSDTATADVQLERMLVDELSDGAYVVLQFHLAGIESPRELELNYTAFFDVDPLHRGMLRLEEKGFAVFSQDNATQRFELGEQASSHSFLAFIREGIWHIQTGYDHILFLVALLLPGVLRRTATGWEPVTGIRAPLISVLQIVTAFTVAHSITLSLAALEVVQLPPRLVESAIAATVALAAFNNIVRVLPERGWQVAFVFGLIHGFGFANALGDLGLSGGQFALVLFGFNLGVELGQLALVAVAFPLLLWLKNVKIYRRGVLAAGSAAITLLAAAWFAERCLDFKWLPF